MNTLCKNHRFVFSCAEKNMNLYIINGKVFLEDLNGQKLSLNILCPTKKSSLTNILNSICKSIDPNVVLSVLKKKTFIKNWNIISN